MKTRQQLESMFKEHDFSDYRWIDPRDIVVAQWVRMKCIYGCNEYGKNASCPPNVPSIPECERFFKEYSDGVIFHFEKVAEKPEDRFPWTRKLNKRLLKLEREVFISGYQKAFLLFLDSCNLCDECKGRRELCLYPRQARPTPESMGVDVFATVGKIGYPIQVLSDYSKKMNRYAFLFIE